MIEIIREDTQKDKLLEFDILIDGKEMTKIKNGEKVTLKLRSNNYKIQIVSKRCKSNCISFTMDKDIITFNCIINYRNNIFSKFIHKVILKNSIKLQIK